MINERGSLVGGTWRALGWEGKGPSGASAQLTLVLVWPRAWTRAGHPAEPGLFTCKQRLPVLEAPSKHQAQHRPLITNGVEKLIIFFYYIF